MEKLFSNKKIILWSLGVFNLIFLTIVLIVLWKYALQCEREYNICRESYSENYGETFCNKCEMPLLNIIESYNKIRLKIEYSRCKSDFHKCLKNIDSCSNWSFCPPCVKRLNKKGDYYYHYD